jgi:hypothetical protein
MFLADRNRLPVRGRRGFCESTQESFASSKNNSTEKSPSNPAPGGQSSSFVGIYENPYFGKLGMEEQQGRLILRLPPLGTYYELSPLGQKYIHLYIANEVSGAARRGMEFSGDCKLIPVQDLKFEYSNVFEKSSTRSRDFKKRALA